MWRVSDLKEGAGKVCVSQGTKELLSPCALKVQDLASMMGGWRSFKEEKNSNGKYAEELWWQ